MYIPKSSILILINHYNYDSIKNILNNLVDNFVHNIYISIDYPDVKDSLNIILYNKILNYINNFLKLYPKKNIMLYKETKHLGIIWHPYNSISWFFKYEEKGIILDEDYIPLNSFYYFCDDLLNYYNDNENIKCINGWSYFYNNTNPKLYGNSFYFSLIAQDKGLGLWKRTWQDIDIYLNDLSIEKLSNKLSELGFTNHIINKYIEIYKQNSSYSWYYYFLFTAIFMKNGLCILPIYNLLNIYNYTDDMPRYTTNEITNLLHPKNIENILEFDILLCINNNLMYYK